MKKTVDGEGAEGGSWASKPRARGLEGRVA